MISGLLEIIERDSFMIMWYNSLSLPRLDILETPVSEQFKELLDPSKFTLSVVDTTSDIGIPSAFGLLTTRDGKVSVGGSARLSMEDAVRKTLMEISQLFIGNKAQDHQSPHQSISGFLQTSHTMAKKQSRSAKLEGKKYFAGLRLRGCAVHPLFLGMGAIQYSAADVFLSGRH